MDKNGNRLIVYVNDELELELRRMADQDRIELAAFMRKALSHYVYGHRVRNGEKTEGQDSAE